MFDFDVSTNENNAEHNSKQPYITQIIHTEC